ncbi:MAG TPA: hypothetical protein VFV02_17745, partial [Acidimicrobiales bacterium]|nr:hypothetical protein [Acidimicrobiales bacterium]
TTGITGAAPIWHQVMAHALTGVKDNWPAMPAGLTSSSTQYGIAYFMPNTDATTGESLLVPVDQSGPPVDGLPAITAARKHHHKHPLH